MEGYLLTLFGLVSAGLYTVFRRPRRNWFVTTFNDLDITTIAVIGYDNAQNVYVGTEGSGIN